MTTSRSVGVLVLVAILGLTVAPAASGAVVGAFTDDGGVDSDDAASANNSVSTFMHASAADTETTVDSEMFEARYAAADNDSRDDIVLDRTNDHEEQLATLEEERATLEEGGLHDVEYQAKMTQLTVEIRSLERSIDRTEDRALEAGVDKERLKELRTNANELEGPEVAEIARSLAGPNTTFGGGPPAESGAENQGGQNENGPPANADPGSSDDNDES